MTDSFIIVGGGGHGRSVEDIVRYAMGLGGITPESLQRRLDLLRKEMQEGKNYPPLVHPAAWVSPTAKLGKGSQIMPMAVVNAYADIGEGAIINSAAVVEHDAIIGAGAHIAPRATILGGAVVEECAFIGAGAVVIQGTTARGFVKALSISSGEK